MVIYEWRTAYGRFGLGARGKEPSLRGDPREVVEAELARPGAGRMEGAGLESGEKALARLYAYKAAKAETRAKAEVMRAAGEAVPAPSVAAMIPPPGEAIAPKPANPVAEIYHAEAQARLHAALSAPIGYVERLVAFWSNHFCVSAAKDQNVRILAGAFEREAIRPYVLGGFADMLHAVESHPAMLHYLDNAQSVGPNSPAGRDGDRGLNENLAREILELHTLGADGGYAQPDVTEFARALTGWTIAGPEGRLGPPGTFVFNVKAHEGGARTLLGRTYAQQGYAQAAAVLEDLAHSAATARHVAAKLARAFVADAPPPALIARLSDVFVKTDGDLGALARALIADDLAWEAPAQKLRDPWEMLVGAYRALGVEPQPSQRVLRLLALLGAPLWTPAGPNGFPVETAAWASPAGLKARLDVATALGRIAKDAPSPADLLERVLPGASAETRDAVLRAESRPQAYALALMAPEFQRR